MAKSSNNPKQSESSATESALSRIMRKQQRSLNRMLLFMLPVVALPLLIVIYIDRKTGVGVDLTWFIVLALVFPAAALAVPFLMRGKRRRIEALVPAHDGLVCPQCIQPLVPAGDAMMRCERCTRQFEPDELRKYWDMSITDPFASLELWRTMMKKQPSAARPRGLRARFLRRRDNMLWEIGSITAVFLFVGAIYGMVMGSSLVAGMLSLVHMIPFMVGLMMLMSNWKRREGDVSFCAACGYQRAPGTSRTALKQCPECGEDWNQIGTMKHGIPKRRRGRMAVGLMLATLGTVLIASPPFLGDWRAKIMPTSSLIHEVTRTNAGFVYAEWTELNTRTLTPEQIMTLAEGLLAKRVDKSHGDRDDDDWLVAQIAAGTLPDALVERYYSEALDVWLFGPERAKVGEQVTVAIGTEYRAGGGRNPTPTALIAGFFVNDDPQPRGRQTQAIDGIMLGQVRLHFNRRDAGPGNGPVLTLKPEAPGAVNVRLEFWIAHAPMGTVTQITWNEDGTPVTPAGAVWMEHRVVEHVIEVRE